MKKVFLSVVAIILLFTFTGCTPKSVTVGKYYLENSNDAYIEIISETEIAFVNAEFPEVEAGLFDVFGEMNVAERLASTYDFTKNSNLYVEIFGIELDGEPYPMALGLDYSKKDKALSTTDQIFILK
jgi:sorbitol-specific phosphotransferase system component IIC